MMKENLVFHLTENAMISNKLSNSNTKDLVSNQMLNDEIESLCNNETLLKALKVNNTSQNKIIYIFKANTDNQDYSQHRVSSVKVVVDLKNIDINKDNIELLDQYTNEVNNLNVYKTCEELFVAEVINNTPVQGFSIGTYSLSKDTKGFTFNTTIEQSNWNNYVIYDDHHIDYANQETSKLEKTFALKG